MEDLEATCIHTMTSEIKFLFFNGKIHITLHLSNCLVEINLKGMVTKAVELSVLRVSCTRDTLT